MEETSGSEIEPKNLLTQGVDIVIRVQLQCSHPEISESITLQVNTLTTIEETIALIHSKFGKLDCSSIFKGFVLFYPSEVLRESGEYLMPLNRTLKFFCVRNREVCAFFYSVDFFQFFCF